MTDTNTVGDTRCRSPINGLASLHRPSPVSPWSVRGRSNSLGQKIASRVEWREALWPSVRPVLPAGRAARWLPISGAPRTNRSPTWQRLIYAGPRRGG